MAATDKFETIKKIVGALRNDTPPTVADGEPGALRINSNSELIVTIGSGTGTISIQGDVAHDAADSGNPAKIGGTATAAEATVVDEGDRVQASFTLAGRQRIDSDITRVGSNTVVTAGINGVQSIAGPTAHDSASTAYPVPVGAVYDASPSAIDDGDIARLITDSTGQLRTAEDIVRIGGNTVASIGVNGGLFVGGDVADDAASTASNPIKIGAVADEVLTTVADDDVVELRADLYRRLLIKEAAFDTLTTSDKVTNLNTDATDRDTAGIIDLDEDAIAASPSYGPSSAGRLYGTRNKRTWSLTLDDVTSCELEESDDGGTTWIPVTASLIDMGTGLTGYAATHFTSAAGVSTKFKVQMEHPSPSVAYRWNVVTPNATNDVLIMTAGRAN